MSAFATIKQERRQAEADQRREQQRFADLRRLRPVDAARAAEPLAAIS
jgi:hypothetical protein